MGHNLNFSQSEVSDKPCVILGCGYLGSHLANYFIRYSEVIVIGRRSFYTSLLHSSISFYEVDLYKVDEYADLIPKDSVVVHAANHINSTNTFADLEHDLIDNYSSFIKLINVCDERGIFKFVFISSAGTVYGNTTEDIISEEHPLCPVNIYGLQKMYFENLMRIKRLESRSFNYVVLRVSNPYGGMQDPEKKQGIIPILVNKAMSEEVIELWASRETTRDYIYMNDFLDATRLIINITSESPTEFNVGSGQGNTLNTVIDFIEIITQKKIKTIAKVAKTTAINSNVLNISRLIGFGFQPRYSLKDGINELVKQLSHERNEDNENCL